jgi:hypothetical protein
LGCVFINTVLTEKVCSVRRCAGAAVCGQRYAGLRVLWGWVGVEVEV